MSSKSEIKGLQEQTLNRVFSSIGTVKVIRALRDGMFEIYVDASSFNVPNLVEHCKEIGFNSLHVAVVPVEQNNIRSELYFCGIFSI